MENERTILNFEDNIEDVKALFESAKRSKHGVILDRAELLDNYDIETITGLEVTIGRVDTVEYQNEQVNLLGYLERLLQGKMDLFLSKVLNVETTDYQHYSKTSAEHALNILGDTSKQSKEMKKAFRNIKGLKQVLYVIWSGALVNPLQYNPTKDDCQGVAQVLTINYIYEHLAPRTKGIMTEKKLKNIINLLIVAGALERLSYYNMTIHQRQSLMWNYPELYKCPTFYLCYDNLECANWERINNLSEKTVVTPDAVRAVYGDEVADRMLPITGQPDRKRLELTKLQIDNIAEVLTSKGVTVYDELVAELYEGTFGDLHEIGLAINANNLKQHLDSFEALGYFNGLGVETMTASKARRKGYDVPTGLNGRTKVYVH